MPTASVRGNCLGCEKPISWKIAGEWGDYDVKDREMPYIVQACLLGAIVKCGACDTQNMIQPTKDFIQVVKHDIQANRTRFKH